MSRSATSINSGVDASALIERPRVSERLAAAAEYPISVLIAPAGYGKSVALRQHLRALGEPNVCFGLRPEHARLLGFLRGFCEVLRRYAPHAITALAGAYERSADSQRRGADLASWMDAHLEACSGVIAIDDLHVVGGDLEAVQFLASIIERTKERIRWILASRSTIGLPIGTWLAYREVDMVIAEGDLAFTLDEARKIADRLGLLISEDDLADIVRLTEGWPAAMGFALRTSMRSASLRNTAVATREMIYRLLAEQVYAALDKDERSLLEVAIALPAIDVSVLERAGFDRALTIVERLRDSTAFIYEESPRVYQCHELFRDFLRHQSALSGKRAHLLVHIRAAAALEANDDIEHALGAYVAAKSSNDIVRLLEKHGFDLLEQARSDIVARAIEALSEKIRHENAAVLALQGALYATLGKGARAESCFRRALARPGTSRDLLARTSLRLASLVANQGKEVTSILSVVGDDPKQNAAHRLEAFSLTAGQRAVDGDAQAAKTAVVKAEALTAVVESDAVRARALHHIGIAFRHLGMVDQAFDALRRSSELAADLHLYGVMSRVNAVLSNLSLHEADDVNGQLRYAEVAAEAAMRAGDAFALQTALLQMLSARMRQGDAERSVEIEQRLLTLRGGELVTRYVALFRCMRLGWECRFGEAQQLMARSWSELGFEFDRIFCGSHYAVFLACDGERDQSESVTKSILSTLATANVVGPFRIRAMAIAKALCALAEAANGRVSLAHRVLRGLSEKEDSVVSLTTTAVEGIIERLRFPGDGGIQRVSATLERLAFLGYGDVARLLSAVSRVLRVSKVATSSQPELTGAELNIVRLLAEGFVPKEIAERSGRSVFTVRVHIANVIAKLGCHGRSEAIRKAQQLNLI